MKITETKVVVSKRKDDRRAKPMRSSQKKCGPMRITEPNFVISRRKDDRGNDLLESGELNQ
jgi:hypothetical protein